MRALFLLCLAGCTSEPAIDAADLAVGDAASAVDDLPAPAAPAVQLVGRIDESDSAGPRFAWSGSSLTARFSGTSVSVTLKDGSNYYEVYVDGTRQPVLATTSGTKTYLLASGLAAGTHTLLLYRRTEASIGETQFLGLTFDPTGALLSPPPRRTRKIELVGDSISCGYGNEGADPCNFTRATENHYLSYGAIAARQLDADLITVAWSGFGMVRNCCGNIDPPMPALYDYALPRLANHVAGGVAWDFQRYVPDVVVINLGANDFSLGDPGQPYQDAYVTFVHRLRTLYPSALIVCAIGPNLAPATAIKSVVATLTSAGDANIKYLELAKQAPGPTGCDGHPSLASHQIMADALTAFLRQSLPWQ